MSVRQDGVNFTDYFTKRGMEKIFITIIGFIGLSISYSYAGNLEDIDSAVHKGDMEEIQFSELLTLSPKLTGKKRGTFNCKNNHPSGK